MLKSRPAFSVATAMGSTAMEKNINNNKQREYFHLFMLSVRKVPAIRHHAFKQYMVCKEFGASSVCQFALKLMKLIRKSIAIYTTLHWLF